MRKLLLTFMAVFCCHPGGAAAQSISDANPPTRQDTSTFRLDVAVPGPHNQLKHDFVRMQAKNTPSGFRVPRFVTLKYGSSNGRTGPSRGHPVAWRYKRKGLPMIVVAETELWRKVRDVNGDESWMDRRLLTGKKMVLARTEITLQAKPRSDSKRRAIAPKGALLELQTCEDGDWCLVSSQDGHMAGYAPKSLLWGAHIL